MAYFPRKMNSIERGCKVLADVLVALLLFSIRNCVLRLVGRLDRIHIA